MKKLINEQSQSAPAAVKINRAAYDAIVATAGLKDVTLVSNNFSILPEYFSVQRRGKKANKKLDRVIGCEIGNVEFNKKSDVTGGTITWSLNIKHGDTNLLTLSCSYVAVYEGISGYDRTAVRYFFGKVGRFATYPYFRAMASQMSWASGADLPIMPILRDVRSSLRSRKK